MWFAFWLLRNIRGPSCKVKNECTDEYRGRSPCLGHCNPEGANRICMQYWARVVCSPDLDAACSIPRLSSPSRVGNIHEIIFIRYLKSWGNYTLPYVEQVLFKEQHSLLGLRTYYKGKRRNKEPWTPVPMSSVTLVTSINLGVISLLCDRKRVARQKIWCLYLYIL